MAVALFAVNQSPQAFSCASPQSSLDLLNVVKVASGPTAFYLGYQQVTSNNQDPILIRYDNGVRTFCQTNIETTTDDGKGVALAWDTDTQRLFGVFTSTGNGAGTTKYQNYTSAGWVPNFFGTLANSSGAKVSVILRLSAATGVPETGTFVGAKLSSSAANTCVPRELGFGDGALVVLFDSYYSPIDAPGASPGATQAMACTGASPLPFYTKWPNSLAAPLELCGTPAQSGAYCNATNTLATCPRGQLSGVRSASGPLLSALLEPAATPTATAADTNAAGSLAGSPLLRAAAAAAAVGLLVPLALVL
eukprot:TRINITY_DN944_c0_g1_i1.p1 TRINITY_DN944_c0_g1~~TRINITY_DN944_c0_g1_i1.p1  ORF type:complete len:329 (-),score=78.49 TRINITY_DN944_c0_g1_i1:33-953(-)